MASFLSSIFSSSPRDSKRVVRDRATNTITVEAAENVDALVVLAHGLGDTAEGLVDVAQMFSQKLPRVKFILPTAPTQPITLSMGMKLPAWYDIPGLSDRANEECEGIEDSMEIIQKIMDEQHENEGIPYNRMILAGFSQGGAISLLTGYQLEKGKKVGGVVCMSGYLAGGAKRFKLTPGLEDTPVVHFHGTWDPMVKYKWAELTETLIKEQGASNYKLVPIQGMLHTVSPEELGMALEFIESCLEEKASGAKFEKAEVHLGEEAGKILDKPEKDEH